MPNLAVCCLEGYIKVEISGYSAERFLNLCSAHHIYFWKLHDEGNVYVGMLQAKDFKKLCPLVRKAKIRIRILQKSGLPFFIKRHRKRKLFALGILSFFALLYLMSLFVWRIDFSGNVFYTREFLLGYLKEQNIYCGTRTSQIGCDELEQLMRAEFPRITWVSARVKGTGLLVQIKENETGTGIEQGKDQAEDIKQTCDLVAEKPGIIRSIIVRNGVPMVKSGDTVEAGQILVSGLLPVTNDSDEVITQNRVRADADILAETSYSIRKRIPQTYETSAFTGKAGKGATVRVGTGSLTVLLPYGGNQKLRIWTQEHQLELLDSFFLPLYLDVIHVEEVCIYEKTYSQKEKEILAEKMNQQIIEKLCEKGVQIIENNVKILECGVTWEVEETYKTIEPVGTPQPIAEIEGEEETR